ncbi:MAG: hypothetical protein R3C03_03400 [Pirellulaceae bacterium]
MKRARRPDYKESDWRGVFFDNLFLEGLVGNPPPEGESHVAQAASPAVQSTSNDSDGANDVLGWNSLIDPESLENEIKRQQINLEALITTPLQFQTDYLKIRDAFSMLSAWMAIVRDYNGDVRWKNDAAAAQTAFARTAANCRTGSELAFNNARQSQDALREMVRGGSFPETELPSEDFAWNQAVDRNPLMRQLQVSLDRLKQNTGSKSAFENEIEEVLHDANLIAAIARITGDESMDDADDDDYKSFAIQMMDAAVSANESIRLSNFDLVASSVNKIEQSCNDCHSEWR